MPPCLKEGEHLVVDLHVTDAVRERVDARAQQPFGVGEVEDVGRDREAVLVGFVDDGRVERRAELLVLAVAVVHPDLDDVDLQGRLIPHRLARLLLRRHPVRHVGPARLRARDAAAGGTEAGAVWHGGAAHLKRQVALVGAEAEHGTDSPVGPPLEIGDQAVTVGARVGVRVDDRRDDRLACERHHGGALRRLHVPRPSHSYDAAVLHEQRRILQWRPVLTRNDSGAGEDRRRGRSLCLCRLLAAEGAIVICCDKLGDNAESVAREIREAGGRAEAFTLDITRSADVRAMVAQVAQAHGRIDILVNNAGYDAIKPFVDTTEEEWDFLIDLNLKGQLLMTHAVLPHMIAASHGKIVFISSDAARVGSTNEAVYAAAKAGLLGFTKTLAREVARNNIRVNCICPGVTNTPQLQRNLEDPVIGKIVRAIEKKVPLRRFGEPEEIAGAVLFFVSDQSSFITGQVLSVSGGLTMV